MASPQDRVCPVCGRRNRNTDRCTFCGTGLMPDDATPQQDETPPSRQTVEPGSYDVSLDPLPEGLSLRPKYAGFWIRFVAYSIDSFLVSLFAGILLAVGVSGYLSGSDADLLHEIPTLVSSMTWGWMNMVGFALTMAYFTYFLGSRGQTPGKMLCGLKVIRLDGSPVGYGQAALRTLGYSLNHLTLGIGFLWVAFDPRKQGFHDKIARTCEIRLGLVETPNWEPPPRADTRPG